MIRYIPKTTVLMNPYKTEFNPKKSKPNKLKNKWAIKKYPTNFDVINSTFVKIAIPPNNVTAIAVSIKACIIKVVWN